MPAIGKVMVTGDRVSEDRLLEGTQRRALADIDAVNRALLRRVADADIGVTAGRGRSVHRGRAGGGVERQIALPIVEIEAVIVACFVVGEDRVDRPQRNGVGVVGFPVEPTRGGPIAASEAIQLVLGLLRPEAIFPAGALVVARRGRGQPIGRTDFAADALIIGFEIVGDLAALEIAARDQNPDLATADLEPVGRHERGFILVAVAIFGYAEPGLAAHVQTLVVECRARDDVDVASHGFTGHFGRHRLGYDDL